MFRKATFAMAAGLVLAGPALRPAHADTQPYIGDIIMVGFNFCPRDWAPLTGQLLPIAQHRALYALLGTAYGGDGQTSFALPDMRGRAPAHMGAGVGTSPRAQGEKFGYLDMQPDETHLPSHIHDAQSRAESALVASAAPVDSASPAEARFGLWPEPTAPEAADFEPMPAPDGAARELAPIRTPEADGPEGEVVAVPGSGPGEEADPLLHERLEPAADAQPREGASDALSPVTTQADPADDTVTAQADPAKAPETAAPEADDDTVTAQADPVPGPYFPDEAPDAADPTPDADVAAPAETAPASAAYVSGEAPRAAALADGSVVTSASTILATAGASQPFAVSQPSVGMIYCIALYGAFPPRD
ncbi:tail fiber protein [Pseudoponticoccus marisrubri]|uniref:Phage tail collar domain-containing protein n=1 Tax=Pseudoponticoccus marisrubri TaxID=1685382 RepID=A0A0W7WFQ0_9RHOB|nr:tail fiber protein [Pseudoponticoccus marisrubri]KUF09434.1 hypothetical protein AVJ23_17485 [Pseudoponticoccus marisrubri]